MLDRANQLPVEPEKQLRLVPDEPTSKLLGHGTWRVVAGVLRGDF